MCISSRPNCAPEKSKFAVYHSKWLYDIVWHSNAYWLLVERYFLVIFGKEILFNSDRDYSLYVDSANGDTVKARNFVATLQNGALINTSSNYKYIELDGVNDYIDLGDNSHNCLGNVELCLAGLTLSMWVFPTKLQDGRQW